MKIKIDQGIKQRDPKNKCELFYSIVFNINLTRISISKEFR